MAQLESLRPQKSPLATTNMVNAAHSFRSYMQKTSPQSMSSHAAAYGAQMVMGGRALRTHKGAIGSSSKLHRVELRGIPDKSLSGRTSLPVATSAEAADAIALQRLHHTLGEAGGSSFLPRIQGAAAINRATYLEKEGSHKGTYTVSLAQRATLSSELGCKHRSNPAYPCQRTIHT